MNPASMQALVDALAQGQAAQSQGAPPQQQPGAQKWQGDTDDPASSDPDFEKIQSGVFDMSPLVTHRHPVSEVQKAMELE